MWTCLLETRVQLYFPSGTWLANRKMAYHRKDKKTPDNKFQTHVEVEGIIHKILLLLDLHLWCVGCRRLGSTYGWHLSADDSPVTCLLIEMSLSGSDPLPDLHRPGPSLEQAGCVQTRSTHVYLWMVSPQHWGHCFTITFLSECLK